MALVSRNDLGEFARLQSEVIASFLSIYPNAQRDLMLSVPKDGKLNAFGKTWLFKKHGTGVVFSHPESGVLIDAHKFYEGVGNPIDAWRLLQFLESRGLSSMTEQAIEESLASSAREGFLRHVGGHVYELRV